MKLYTVFYAGLVLHEFDNDKEYNTWSRAACHGSPEIYNGAYVHVPTRSPWQGCEWFRCDLTPVLLEDVPKELLLSVLLLN